MIDDVDLKILSIVQADARTPRDEIARQVGLDPSAIAGRIERLEKRGIISGYLARLSPRALGLELTAFVFVQTDCRQEAAKTAALLAKIPEVLEVHRVAGKDCYLVKVRVANTEALGRLVREKLEAIRFVRSTETTIVLKTLKETARLPLKRLAPRTASA
jgi:Lrp/AsnC family leucine-responsive transcriptional regulator